MTMTMTHLHENQGVNGAAASDAATSGRSSRCCAGRLRAESSHTHALITIQQEAHGQVAVNDTKMKGAKHGRTNEIDTKTSQKNVFGKHKAHVLRVSRARVREGERVSSERQKTRREKKRRERARGSERDRDTGRERKHR